MRSKVSQETNGVVLVDLVVGEELAPNAIFALGRTVGTRDGFAVGAADGFLLGIALGKSEGTRVGLTVWTVDGTALGIADGMTIDGALVGCFVGAVFGESVVEG